MKTCPDCCQSIDPHAVKCQHCGSRQPDAPSLSRDVPGRVLGGVCASLARQYGWDPLLVRVVFLCSIGITGGLAFWAYALLWVMTPFTANGKAPLTRFVDWFSRLFNPGQRVEEKDDHGTSTL